MSYAKQWKIHHRTSIRSMQQPTGRLELGQGPHLDTQTMMMRVLLQRHSISRQSTMPAVKVSEGELTHEELKHNAEELPPDQRCRARLALRQHQCLAPLKLASSDRS